MMTRSRVLLPAVLCSSLACAGQSGGPREPAPNYAELTAEEIASVSGATSLHDVVRIRRPRWLNPPRPTSVNQALQTSVVVYMDNVKFGGAEMLRQLHPSVARRLQYLTASQAETRFGVGHPNGAIVVLTKPGA